MDRRGGINRVRAGESETLDSRLWEAPASHTNSGLASARLLTLTTLAS